MGECQAGLEMGKRLASGAAVPRPSNGRFAIVERVQEGVDGRQVLQDQLVPMISTILYAIGERAVEYHDRVTCLSASHKTIILLWGDHGWKHGEHVGKTRHVVSGAGDAGCPGHGAGSARRAAGGVTHGLDGQP
jgi:hypothetical protein